jgi:hypothetical protein
MSEIGEWSLISKLTSHTIAIITLSRKELINTVARRPVVRQRPRNKQLQQPLLNNESASKHVSTAAITLNGGTVFSARSVPRYYKQGHLAVADGRWVSKLQNCYGSVVVSCCCEKLVAEAGESSGTKGKGNVRRWRPPPSNGCWSL